MDTVASVHFLVNLCVLSSEGLWLEVTLIAYTDCYCGEQETEMQSEDDDDADEVLSPSTKIEQTKEEAERRSRMNPLPSKTDEPRVSR